MSDNMRQRCFAHAGRSHKENVIQCIVALPGGKNGHLQVLTYLFLSDVLTERLRTKMQLFLEFLAGRRTHHNPFRFPLHMLILTRKERKEIILNLCGLCGLCSESSRRNEMERVLQQGLEGR